MRYGSTVALFLAVWLLAGCYSDPVYNDSANGTDTVSTEVRPGVVGLPGTGGDYKDTLLPDQANTYRFTATAETMVLYARPLSGDDFTWRCLFDGEGETGARSGADHCAFTGLTAGASYTFLIEEVSGGPLAFYLRVVEEYGEGNLTSPVTLTLGADPREAVVGAYRETNYYAFDGTSIENYYEILVDTDSAEMGDYKP